MIYNFAFLPPLQIHFEYLHAWANITDKRTDACSRPLCTYTQIWIPQQPIKKRQKHKILCSFSVRTLQCFQFFFFKLPSKVAHNRPQTFFSSTDPAAQTSPKLVFHVINIREQASVL